MYGEEADKIEHDDLEENEVHAMGVPKKTVGILLHKLPLE